MKWMIFKTVLLLWFVSGCTTIKIVPQSVDNGRIDPADNSLIVNKNGIEVSVKPDISGLNNYNLDSAVASFHMSIVNSTANEIAFTNDSFVLVDESGLQYELLTPDKVREMLKKDSYYLMPYPYVGFYYLEDFQKTNFYNRFNSSLPYYYDLYPQDLFTQSLPMTTVIPKMKIEGRIYFKIDISAHKYLKLLIYRKGVSKSNIPDFELPYSIIK